MTLGDRVGPRSHNWAIESVENAEWEIAIDTVWESVERGDLDLSTSERDDLEALSNHPDVEKQLLPARERVLRLVNCATLTDAG